jgi:hypothetical protein
MILEWINSVGLGNIHNQADHVRMWQRFGGRDALYVKPGKAQRHARRDEFRKLDGGIEFEAELDERVPYNDESGLEPDDVPL